MDEHEDTPIDALQEAIRDLHGAASTFTDTSRRRCAWSVVVASVALFLGCTRGPRQPQHRERFAARNGDCLDPARPRAFMYPAENRTDYGPDDPRADGCVLDVPDHLFCCPDATRPTDR